MQRLADLFRDSPEKRAIKAEKKAHKRLEKNFQENEQAIETRVKTPKEGEKACLFHTSPEKQVATTIEKNASKQLEQVFQGNEMTMEERAEAFRKQVHGGGLARFFEDAQINCEEQSAAIGRDEKAAEVQLKQVKENLPDSLARVFENAQINCLEQLGTTLTEKEYECPFRVGYSIWKAIKEDELEKPEKERDPNPAVPLDLIHYTALRVAIPIEKVDMVLGCLELENLARIESRREPSLVWKGGIRPTVRFLPALFEHLYES